MKTARILFFTLNIFALAFAFGATTSVDQDSSGFQAGTVTWTCNAFYLPARSIWKRSVAIDYDAEGIRTVAIDGVLVYSFNVIDRSVLTAIDGERIQFDATAQTWTSDLRGLVSSEGRCER